MGRLVSHVIFSLADGRLGYGVLNSRLDNILVFQWEIHSYIRAAISHIEGCYNLITIQYFCIFIFTYDPKENIRSYIHRRMDV